MPLSNRSTLTEQRHGQCLANNDTRFIADASPVEAIFFRDSRQQSR